MGRALSIITKFGIALAIVIAFGMQMADAGAGVHERMRACGCCLASDATDCCVAPDDDPPAQVPSVPAHRSLDSMPAVLVRTIEILQRRASCILDFADRNFSSSASAAPVQAELCIWMV